MSAPLRLIQVGCGGWGWSWIGIVQRSRLWGLQGIVDVSSSVLEKARETYGLAKEQTFTDLADALQHMEADAALIVVPPKLHAPVAEQALGLGLHCLVEKPLADTVTDANRIVTAGKESGKRVMVSQNYRFKRAPQTVKRVVKSGVIGEIGIVYLNFQKAPPFTGFRVEMDEPVLTDFCIHNFDQMRGILGLEPVRIAARSWNPKWSIFAGNAVASVTIEMQNRAIAVYNASWVSQGWETTWDGDWRIQGDGGEVYWSNNEVSIRPKDLFKTVFMKDAVERDGILHADLLPMEFEEREAVLAEFAAAIIEDREPETNAFDNLRSMAMVLAAVDSAKRGEPVWIEEILGQARTP